MRTQIWNAIAPYGLVAILKKRLQTELSFYIMLQILGIPLFKKIELAEAFAPATSRIPAESTCNQVDLFDL